MVATVSVAEPDPTRDAGLNVAVSLLGVPLTLRPTVPVNPAIEPMLTV